MKRFFLSWWLVIKLLCTIHTWCCRLMSITPSLAFAASVFLGGSIDLSQLCHMHKLTQSMPCRCTLFSGLNCLPKLFRRQRFEVLPYHKRRTEENFSCKLHLLVEKIHAKDDSYNVRSRAYALHVNNYKNTKTCSAPTTNIHPDRQTRAPEHS